MYEDFGSILSGIKLLDVLKNYKDLSDKEQRKILKSIKKDIEYNPELLDRTIPNTNKILYKEFLRHSIFFYSPKVLKYKLETTKEYYAKEQLLSSNKWATSNKNLLRVIIDPEKKEHLIHYFLKYRYSGTDIIDLEPFKDLKTSNGDTVYHYAVINTLIRFPDNIYYLTNNLGETVAHSFSKNKYQNIIFFYMNSFNYYYNNNNLWVSRPWSKNIEPDILKVQDNNGISVAHYLALGLSLEQEELENESIMKIQDVGGKTVADYYFESAKHIIYYLNTSSNLILYEYFIRIIKQNVKKINKFFNYYKKGRDIND